MKCFDAIADTHGRSAADLSRNSSVASRLIALHAIDLRDKTEEARGEHRRAFHPEPRDSKALAEKMKADLARSAAAINSLGLRSIPADAIQRLPRGAVILEFGFTLEKKFVSRDDAVFYPNENPIRKEWVFKIPMTPGSTWKGNLRAAAVENLILTPEAGGERATIRMALIDIFGDEKGRDIDDGAAKDESLAAYLDRFVKLPAIPPTRRGRVRFLPSYYERLDLDVLNPRDKKTRAGTVPVVMEVVPPGSTGRFGIIYFPFDLIGKAEGEIRRQLSRDWVLLGPALHRMFRISGFGAKKSNGCGKARETISEFRFECGLPGFRVPRMTRLEELRELGGCFGDGI